VLSRVLASVKGYAGAERPRLSAAEKTFLAFNAESTQCDSSGISKPPKLWVVLVA
jgi:hypothetical protein